MELSVFNSWRYVGNLWLSIGFLGWILTFLFEKIVLSAIWWERALAASMWCRTSLFHGNTLIETRFYENSRLQCFQLSLISFNYMLVLCVESIICLPFSGLHKHTKIIKLFWKLEWLKRKSLNFIFLVGWIYYWIKFLKFNH